MEPRDRRRSKLPLLMLGLLSGGGLAFALAGALAVGDPPQITLEQEPKALGRKASARVAVEAPGRGLSEVRVELLQQGRSKVLAERAHTPRPFWAPWAAATQTDAIEVELGKEALPDLLAGEATLKVTAAGAGGWLRRATPTVFEKTFPVRFTPPQLFVTSQQNNAAQGGSGVVVYRVGEGTARDGVQAGEWFFPGYPLPGGGAGERFALYAVPYDLAEASRIRLVAEDDAGNRAEIAFVERYTQRPLTAATIQLDDSFLARVVPEILAQTPEIQDRGNLLDSYLAINGELRRLNNERLVQLAGGTEPRFLWRAPFEQLSNSAVMASFAARRTYLYQGRAVDTQDHLGFDLASNRQAPVEAANAGKVLFAGYLGIYGNTVVLDHGYGLGSLYSHLSSLDVATGDTVEAGQSLGRTGVTGLAGGDHLHFSMLVHGRPVTPVEWWDARWIRDHLKAKLGPALPFPG